MQRVGSQLGPEFSDVLHNSIAASLSIKPPYRLINTFPVKDLPRIEGRGTGLPLIVTVLAS